MIKRILGFIFLFAFIGFMAKKLITGTSHLQDNLLIWGFVIAVVLLLIMIVRRIILS
jgi:hypothetical protein